MIAITCYADLDNDKQIIKCLTSGDFSYQQLPLIAQDLELKINLCNFYLESPFVIYANSPIVSSFIVAYLVSSEAEKIYVSPDPDTLPVLIWDTQANLEGLLLM